MNEFGGYTIPLDMERFFRTWKFGADNTKECIKEHIHLLLITTHSEFAFDADFGCDLWEHEFEGEHVSAVWVDRIAESIKNTLTTYESRLVNIDVKAELTQAEFAQKRGDGIARRLKKRMRVLVSAQLARTNEPFEHEDNVLISPFSLD